MERKPLTRQTSVVSILLLTLIIISHRSTVALNQQELDWKVKIGDSMTYEIIRSFNRDKNSHTFTITDIDGKRVNVTVKEGSTMKVEIIKLDDVATVKKTYNGKFTTDDPKHGSYYVRKTVDNKTYWEGYAKSVGYFLDETYWEDINASVEENLLIVQREREERDWGIQDIVKTDWKTGWVTYLSQKLWNDTDTTFEMVLTVKAAGSVPRVEMGFLLLGIYIMILVITRKKVSKVSK